MKPDFAYLLGAAGDASVIHNPKKCEYYIEYWQKDRRWLERSVKPRIRRLYGKKLKVWPKKNGLFMVRLYSKEAYNAFRGFEKRPERILDESVSVQVHYLRGFFDAEGSAPRRKRGTVYRLHIYQKKRRPLKVLSRILEGIGVRAGSLTSSRDVGILPIRRRENIARFARLVRPEHPAKIRALRALSAR